jgi:hypothetical protein
VSLLKLLVTVRPQIDSVMINDPRYADGEKPDSRIVGSFQYGRNRDDG